MTLAEAVDWVEQEIIPFDVATPEIKRRLRLQNDYLARELRLPTRYVTGVDATAPFALPGNARPGSLVRAWQESNGRQVKLKNVTSASRAAPRWFREDSTNRFILYDPYNLTAPVTPQGFFAGDTLRILVVVKPTDLEHEQDEIWDAELPEHHELVPRRVVIDILRMNGQSEDIVRRAETLASVQDRQMRAAFAKTWFVEGMA